MGSSVLPHPAPAFISPSLSRLYREDLISHVVGWSAEAVEKTCQRVNEDHQNINNLATTRVSAELKMARSLVRLADIQATLQEQRIMFLRQQTADLESYKARSLSHRDSDAAAAAAANSHSSSTNSSTTIHPSQSVTNTSSSASIRHNNPSSSLNDFNSAAAAETSTATVLPSTNGIGPPPPPALPPIIAPSAVTAVGGGQSLHHAANTTSNNSVNTVVR